MILLIAASLCAYFVKGLCGFANTLVFSTIASFGLSNRNISPLELILGYPTNCIMVWRERKAIDWKVCLPLAAQVLIGNIPGIILLKNVDTRTIRLVFGFVIIALGIEMLVRGQMKKTDSSKIVLALIGIISGVLCGLFGIGALLAAYMGRVTDNSRSFKANICVVFIIENTFRMVVYSFTGIITLHIVKQAVVLMPFMVLGLFAGMKSSSVLNENIVKKIVIIMLIVSGIALVAKSV
jgi:uncharacterized protein